MYEDICVEFQRALLKFHTKYVTYTLKDVDFIHRSKFKSSEAFLKRPPAFIKPNQFDPWIKDQLERTLLSTILPL